MIVEKYDESTERWLNEHKDIAYIIELNSFEKSACWQQYKDHWEEVTRGGPMLTLGRIYKRPIVLCLNVIKIKGRKVMITEATSMLVDYKMIDDFEKKRWPHLFDDCVITGSTVHRHAHDANGFHHMVQHIDELNEKSVSPLKPS